VEHFKFNHKNKNKKALGNYNPENEKENIN
jgi:hypothetical protein